MAPLRPNMQEYTLSLYMTVLFSVCVCLLSYALYLRTASVLQEQVDTRLLAIVKTAAGRFSANDIHILQSLDPKERVRSPIYKDVVLTLQKIKQENPEVTFAYIQAKSEVPGSVEFIADANTIAMRPSLNFNEDEVTSEAYPGSLYDVSLDPPFINNTLFEQATTDDSFYETIWGNLKSAYAPIATYNNENFAFLGIDISNADYNQSLSRLAIPFGLFSVSVLALITTLIGIISKLWNEKVMWLKKANTQKNEILNIVSHQLGTPISGLQANLEMMDDGDFGSMEPAVKQQVGKMRGVLHHMTDLVKMLLETSRVEFGHRQVHCTTLRPDELLQEIISRLENKAKEKRIRMTVETAHCLPDCLWDKRLVSLAWENLLSNAIKYTPDGGSMTVRLSAESEGVRLIVQDSGCGIPLEEQANVFRKLHRASNAKNIHGHGLGLYATKLAVEAHEGTIAFTSKEGCGSTFEILLPINAQSSL